MLRCESIRKHYGGVAALKGVSWSLQPGEVHALCGENGAGKSTLARILSGITAPNGGAIFLEERPVTWSGPQEARAAGVAVIPQELDLFNHLSVAENLAIGNPRLEATNWVSPRALHQAARPLLRDVGLELDPAVQVGRLSVSHRQLVAVARALGLEARVLFMDEPTSALTDDAVERLFNLIQRLKARGVTIVYVSHKMDEIFRICDRVSVLRDGEMIGTEACANTTIDRVIRQMVGRAVATRTPEPPAAAGRELLRVRGLSTAKLRDVSFTLERGEILGVAGLVASGRSELGRALFGLSPIQDGEMTLDDRPYRPRHPRDAAANGVALVPEDRQSEGLVAGMSIRHNATLASLSHYARAGWVRHGEESAAATQALKRCGTRYARADLPVDALSGGNQQKVLIAKWLLTRPQLCFLDDPTRGIDIGAKDDIYELMRSLAREGLGLIWVSSELPELLANARRILVLHDGRAMGILDAAQATQEQIMNLATAQAALPS